MLLLDICLQALQVVELDSVNEELDNLWKIVLAVSLRVCLVILEQKSIILVGEFILVFEIRCLTQTHKTLRVLVELR